MGILVRDVFPTQPSRLDHLFRSGMRELAGGVSVITVGEGEDRTGLTATSVTSLSVDPPTLLVCVNRNASAFAALARHGTFAVNLLRAEQAAIAERFAGRGGAKGAARYAGAAWTQLATGAPVLEDALAAFDCEVEEMIERHSHAIVIGKVKEVRLAPNADALVYWRGTYESLVPDARSWTPLFG
jgi:flavin reductase (DIM6/NTAB) family NADH-FMN oxidoreductase RutF